MAKGKSSLNPVTAASRDRALPKGEYMAQDGLEARQKISVSRAWVRIGFLLAFILFVLAPLEAATTTVSAFIMGADGDESATTAVHTFSAYAVGYFANRITKAPDPQLRLTNDGSTEATLWADIYVFNNDEQMEECCSCGVTPDGYLDLDVNHDLLGNELSPEKATPNGIIKVISSSVSGPTAPYPASGIRGWLTQIQDPVTTTSFSITESDLKDSLLSSSELTALAETCSLLLSLGSGAGACSCTPAGH
jgi:hypothetical protein